MFNIKNHVQYYRFIDIPYIKNYYTNNIIIIDHDTLLSRQIRYSKHTAITYNKCSSTMLQQHSNVRRAYQFLNVDNELYLHDTLLYTPIETTNLSGVDVKYGRFDYIWLVTHNNSQHYFNSRDVGFILYRVKKPRRKNVRFFITLSDYNHAGIDKLPTLTLLLDNIIIGIVVSLKYEQSDIPKPLRLSKKGVRS